MSQKEDLDYCWSSAEDGGPCENPPVFKLTILADEDTDNRGEPIPAGPRILFLCRECLPSAIEGTPVAPEIAYVVLPLRLTKEQVRLLREEITEEVQGSPELAA
jgi:hypothetical protein